MKMLPIKIGKVSIESVQVSAEMPCYRCGQDISNDANSGIRYKDIERDDHFERIIQGHLCGNCMSYRDSL